MWACRYAHKFLLHAVMLIDKYVILAQLAQAEFCKHNIDCMHLNKLCMKIMLCILTLVPLYCCYMSISMIFFLSECESGDTSSYTTGAEAAGGVGLLLDDCFNLCTHLTVAQ